eukprot:4700059-Alexandrium_andersonii.AAC.1
MLAPPLRVSGGNRSASHRPSPFGDRTALAAGVRRLALSAADSAKPAPSKVACRACEIVKC